MTPAEFWDATMAEVGAVLEAHARREQEHRARVYDLAQLVWDETMAESVARALALYQTATFGGMAIEVITLFMAPVLYCAVAERKLARSR